MSPCSMSGSKPQGAMRYAVGSGEQETAGSKIGFFENREIYAKILQVRNLSVYLQSELVATADVAQLARAADL